MTTGTEVRLRFRRAWLHVICGLILLFLIVPCLIVVPMSFSGSRFLQFPPSTWSLRWYEALFASIEWREAMFVSLKAAVLTMIVSTPVGVAAAYALHRSKSPAATAVRIALSFPLIVPAILTAIAVFFLFARTGLNNTMIGLVLAHSMLAVPFVIITFESGLKTFDLNQERVARSLGASPLFAFMTITLPQLRFSVASGALFAFVTSLDEVVVSLFIARGENSTLTRRMFSSLRDEIDPTIAAISTLLICLSILILFVAMFIDRKRGVA